MHAMANYVQKCMQWRKWQNWRKIASCWRLELDAKSGPLEAGDFGENGDFGEIGDFGKIARGLAIYGKIFKLDAKSDPFKVDN